MKKIFKSSLILIGAIAVLTACSDDDTTAIIETDANYIGKDVGNFEASEWHPTSSG